MRRLVPLAIVLVCAGCSLGGDSGGASVEAEQLRNLVLQPEDLPRVFIRFDEGRQASADMPPDRADPSRFGREGGWKARYRRPGTPRTPGPLVVESRADAFDSSEGAADELEAAREQLGGGDPGWSEVEAPDLGDEAHAATLVQQGVGRGVRYYLFVWRDDNVTASVLVNGFDGRLRTADAAELARKQQRRIAAAADA